MEEHNPIGVLSIRMASIYWIVFLVINSWLGLVKKETKRIILTVVCRIQFPVIYQDSKQVVPTTGIIILVQDLNAINSDALDIRKKSSSNDATCLNWNTFW